jgi:NitT/TauT family transport system substrate-binding protein
VAGAADAAYQPLAVAARLGYFHAEGLDVDLEDLKEGPAALSALNQGAVDVAAGFYEQVLIDQAQGHAVEMVALLTAAPGVVVLVGPKHAQASSIAGLAGSRIGVTVAGSVSDEVVKYLLQQAGVGAAGAETVPVGTGEAAAQALKSDQIQALATVDPLASTLAQSGDAKVLYDTRTAEGTRAVFGGSWPAAGVYLPADFAAEYPRTVAALVRAVVRGLRYVRAHPPVAATGGSGPVFTEDGTMPPEGPAAVLATLKAAYPALAWGSVDLPRTFDNSFARAAAGVR